MREDQRRECRDRRRQEGRSTRRESQIPGDPEPWEEGRSWEHSLAVADFILEENLTPLCLLQSTTYKENPVGSRCSSTNGTKTATHKQDWLRGNNVSPAAQSVP